jgi:hypothetical protein
MMTEDMDKVGWCFVSCCYNFEYIYYEFADPLCSITLLTP